MDIVNMDEGQYEQQESLPDRRIDSDASSSILESNSSEELSDNDKLSEDEEDLREDLQKNIPECYKSDLNFASHTSSDISNDSRDEEFQTTALCQFMDILNDLDEVLDKSLLACLDDGTRSLDSDDEDIICKLKDSNVVKDNEDVESQSSIDDDTQVICRSNQCSNSQAIEEIQQNDVSRITNFGRSKSFSEISKANSESQHNECYNSVNDSLRNSMRRLDPIVLPTLTTEHTSCEPVTLPVILFLEHHVNMRPTSAPIQLQVTTNISSDGASGPLIVGRRTLLMNRTLSLPSPGDSDVTNGDWTGRNTARSTARSTSASSSSTESLVVSPVNQNMINAADERHEEVEGPPLGSWPHSLSAMLTCLSCTVGLFNISRFAMFSVHFGACFILQFILLSLLVGIPLFTLHLCLGQALGTGPVNMWRVSPLFQGVGVALLVAMAFIGVYSIIGLSWVFVYFRDSFITSDDRYKWALPEGLSYEDVFLKNITVLIEETVPRYFHGEVLKRAAHGYGTIKFHVAFNLAVLWMIVFVALCKGLRSYGKAVYMLIFLPLSCTLILCTKLLTLIPYETVTNVFAQTDWSEFFFNSHSWTAAAQETFLTWGLLSACAMQLTAHKRAGSKNSVTLQRESAGVVACTCAVLALGAWLANVCVLVLRSHGYLYVASSYETVKSSQFLWPITSPVPGNMLLRYRSQYGSLVGVSVWREDKLSGWQPLQLATQIVPAALAVVPPNVLSPVWAVMFYFILIMFGLAQQVAIWHCVVTGIISFNPARLRVWDTTITFFSCVFGLAVGLLLSTDAGVRVVHLVDYVCAGAWWHGVLQAALAVGVFAVRGRPLAADALVRTLLPARGRAPAAAAALLSFVWTVLLPVLLAAICIVDFRVGQQRQLYDWSKKGGGYWPLWARQASELTQQGVLLLLPLTAFVQTWRHLSSGEPDIFMRIQNLYRPHMSDISDLPGRRRPGPVEPAAPTPDPPPKYTPPPSYSTATGARLLNTLRRSFRTIRRITSTRIESADDGQHAPITLSESVERQSEAPAQLRLEAERACTRTLNAHTHDTFSRPHDSFSRTQSSFSRAHVRRSFMRAESLVRVRESLRRSLRARSGSHERLVRHAEPPATSRASVI